MHYLAYALNQAAGAEAPNAVTKQAALDAEALLDRTGYTGTGEYLTSSRAADYKTALMLAGILDAYNNGMQ